MLDHIVKGFQCHINELNIKQALGSHSSIFDGDGWVFRNLLDHKYKPMGFYTLQTL